MFKKLRNKFLILNLVFTLVMMLITFISIYLILYKNVHFQIEVDLHEIEEFYCEDDKDSTQPPIESDTFKPTEENVLPRFVERSVSFYMETDKHWNIIKKSSSFNIDRNLYENGKKAAILQNNNNGSFTVNDEHWSFSISPFPEGYRITFLNTTSQQKILTNLVYTFFMVAIVMLIFIYFISRLFANWSIKPIQEAFDKQRQFIADASHELRTPFAVINTNVDVLLSNGEDTINNQAKWLKYIKSESERMTKLTNDLLFLTHLDYSDIKLMYKNFNMSEAVEYVILTMEALIYEHKLTFIYNIEPKLITYGNDEQIRQVVMILLDNAIKYTNTNGRISLSLERQNNSIILSLTNTGDGISKEHLKNIFDRFYRTDKSRSRKLGGYGLGLSIAKAIIDQHRGSIHADSIINESTTFVITLYLTKE